MATSFADYLESLESPRIAHPAHLSLSIENSPLKRPRSDSPDTSVSSSTSFFLYESATTLSPAASTCALRSILSPTPGPSSPLSSPPISRPLSRRSSNGTSKSVRFARCTNASVFPCLSASDYDRSSIIPTCESESLELPRRKRSEAEGWIKCVERERAAAARKHGGPGPSGPCTAFTPVSLPVEGVHGLIEGGYFVGDESGGIEFEDMIMTDDGTTTDEDAPPALIQDDSSGDDSDGVLSITSADVIIGDAPTLLPISTKKAATPVAPFSVSLVEPIALGFGFLERSSQASDEEESDDEPEFHPEDLDHEDDEEEEETMKADRYGLCALGKYTRAEVFSSHDSLGGF